MERVEQAVKTHHRKHKYAAPVGGLFLLFAAIGLVAVVWISVQLTGAILDNSKEKGKFESIILPVLMFDPPPFEKIQDADPVMVLQSALWAALLGEKRDSYVEDEMGRLIVPASDIDVVSAKLFGTEIQLQHQTFGDFETIYSYDEQTKTYYVPLTGQVGLYTPRVEKVVKKGDLLALTVGYIPPGSAWTVGKDGQNSTPEPDKHMIYELKKNKDSYQLMSIRDAATPVIPVDFTSGTTGESSAQANAHG